MIVVCDGSLGQETAVRDGFSSGALPPPTGPERACPLPHEVRRRSR